MKSNAITIGLLIVFLWSGIEGLSAQWQQYKAAYPEWPFSVEQVMATGNNKCSVWKSRYIRAEGDESGQVWMTPVEDAHQYQRYQFSSGKPMLVSTYLPSGNKLETQEYFYRDNLLSAIEVLAYDTLQDSKLKYALQYLYYKQNDAPAQRTTLYGAPNSRVRVLDEFEFDEDYRLIRQKSTVVGFSPHMDSLLGLKADEKRLISTRYEDSIQTKKVFRDMHLILDDRKTFLDANKRPTLTEVRNAKGEKLWTIDYHYEGEQLTQKVYWVRHTATIAHEEQDKQLSPTSPKGKKAARNAAKAEDRKKILGLTDTDAAVEEVSPVSAKERKAALRVTKEEERRKIVGITDVEEVEEQKRSISAKEKKAALRATKEEERRKIVGLDATEETEPLATIALETLEPVIYKVEYFRYNEDGLLEQHITEEQGQQTVLEYTYFME